VSFELVADLEKMEVEPDLLAAERHMTARDELRRTLVAMNQLPPRCREVVYLRKVEGLTTRETAERLGVGIDAVEQQVVRGMRALTDFLLGGEEPAARTHGQRRKRTL
jgi:RNA polymerase sigma factor (sigma-70 family)